MNCLPQSSVMMNNSLETFDMLLWCNECGVSKFGDCHIHGDLIRMKDCKVRSRARLTVPYCLIIRDVELRPREHEYGVFAKKVIQARTQFGPLEAAIVRPGMEVNYKNLLFKVFHPDHTDVLDISCEDTCNWMLFVRAATNTEQQNMVAYQHKGGIYFTTTKPIPSGGELRVWYAADYGARLGMPPLGNAIIQNMSENTAEVTPEPEQNEETEPSPTEYSCPDCGDSFATPSALDDHVCKDDHKRRNKRKGQPIKLGSRMRISCNQESTKAVEPVPELSQRVVKRGRSQKNSLENKLSKRGGRRKKKPVPEKLYDCIVCGKAFDDRTKLQVHMRCHTGEKPYKCSYPDCTKAFPSKFKLVRHEDTHKGEKNYACSFCGKAFARKDHLKNHLKAHDSNRKKWQCSFCEKEFSTHFGYKTHVAFHMADAGNLTCEVCSQEFLRKDELIFHIKKHSGARSVKDAKDKKCKCPHCDAVFFAMKDVRRHIVVHTRARNFLCQYCPQRFGRRDHLVRHIKKNHPDLPTVPEIEMGKPNQETEKDLLSQAADAASLTQNKEFGRQIPQDVSDSLERQRLTPNPQPMNIHYPLVTSTPPPPPPIQENISNPLEQAYHGYPTNFSMVNNPHRFATFSAIITGIPSSSQHIAPDESQGPLRCILPKPVSKQFDLVQSPPPSQSLAYIQTTPTLIGQEPGARYTNMMTANPRDSISSIYDTMHQLLQAPLGTEPDRPVLPPDSLPLVNDYFDARKAFTSHPSLTHNPFIPPPPTTPVSSVPPPISNSQLIDMSNNLYSQPQPFHQQMSFR